MDKLRIGVIGLGFIGARYVRILAQEPCAELVCVCDTDKSLAEAAAAENGCHWEEDYRKLLARQDIDAVCICVPEDFHSEVAVNAANAKKHILLEKPIAKTAAEGQAIKRACEENGIRLMIAHILNFDARYVQLYDKVKNGELGNISYVSVRRQNATRTAKRFRGRISFMYYVGVHDVAWMLRFAGCRPVRVYAQRNDVINRPLGEYDSVFMTVNFESGAIGSLCVGWPLPENPSITLISGAEVVGSKGMGVITSPGTGLSITTADQVNYPDTVHWPEYNGLIQGDLREAITHFVRATIKGEPYLVDTDEAIEAVAVIEAGFRSIESGLPIML